MPHRHLPFVVLEIEAENPARARSFYSAVFGWSFAESAVGQEALEAEMGRDRGTVVRVHLRVRDPAASSSSQRERTDRRPSHFLCVGDRTPLLKSVVAAGGQLVAGPSEVPGLGTRLYILDTEGNEVAVLQPESTPTGSALNTGPDPNCARQPDPL
jgi:predicted enzyme related to lactoylglutathione lyase